MTIMNTNAIPTFTQMSPTDFAALGLNQIAFVKPVTVEGEAAFAVVRQNDMEPVSTH